MIWHIWAMVFLPKKPIKTSIQANANKGTHINNCVTGLQQGNQHQPPAIYVIDPLPWERKIMKDMIMPQSVPC